MDLILPPYGVRDRTPFGPSPEQSAFHRLRNRYVYACGGAGSGKSHAGSREFITRILEAAEARPGGLLGSKRGVLYAAGAPTRSLTEAGPWMHLTQWFEEFEILNGFSLVRSITLTWARRITLITGDQIMFVHLRSAQEFAGWSLGGFWLDEAELADDPLGAFIAGNNRLRDNRVPNWGIVTSTPRAGASLALHFRDQIAKQDPHYAMVGMRSASNPGLPQETIDTMRATMSDREARMMLDGELLASAGAVYGEEFDESESVHWGWQWHGGPRRDRQYLIAVDNPPNGHALLVEYDPAEETYTVFDEVLTEGDQPDVFFASIVARCEQKWGIRRDHIDGVYIDAMPPHCRKLAYSRAFWKGKVHYRIVRGDRRDKESGIETVRWALRSADGRRRLLFAPGIRTPQHKRGVWQSIQHYSEVQTVRDGMLVRTGKHDNASPWGHACDALRYLLWIRESHRRWYDADRVAA